MSKSSVIKSRKHIIKYSKCKGNGECLKPTIDNHFYTRLLKCRYDCEPEKCPNYKLCGEVGTERDFDYHNGRCIHCNIAFGTALIFKDNEDNIEAKAEAIKESEECPVCMEKCDLQVQMPSCIHYFCVACICKLHSFKQFSKIEYKIPKQREIRVISVREAKELEEDLKEEKEDTDDSDEENESENDEEKEEPEWNSKCPLCRVKTRPHWKKI